MSGADADLSAMEPGCLGANTVLKTVFLVVPHLTKPVNAETFLECNSATIATISGKDVVIWLELIQGTL